MEAAVNKIPGIGVSLDCYSPDADFSAVEKWLPSILDKLLPVLKDSPHGAFYNINFPNLPSGSILGTKVCHMGMAHWEQEYRPYFEFLKEIRSPLAMTPFSMYSKPRSPGKKSM